MTGKDVEEREEQTRESGAAPPRARRLRQALRLAVTVAMFVVLIAGVEVAIGGATALAHQFGYSGSVAQMARYLSLALYGVIILAFVGRRR